MENIQVTVRKDGKLEFVVDPAVELRPSKTRIDEKGRTKGGDNMIVANSGGFQGVQAIAGGFRLNLCLMKPIAKA